MESNKLIILCIWTFLIVLWILSYFGEWDLFIPLLLFFIVLGVTVAVGTWLPEEREEEIELVSELKNLKSKLDSITKDVEEIKITIGK